MRPSKKDYYLNIADAVSARSTCLRRQYGAVIVKDGKIIATGYNGSATGEPNCCDVGTCERERLNVPHGERYELCLSGDTIIKGLDGTYRTIKELSEEKSEFWVYSIDTKKGCIAPALASNIRKTGTSSSMCEILFDDGKTLRCTPDHKILMRNCKYVEARNLSVGDSVMPMYYNFSRNGRYESVCNTISMRKGRLSPDDLCTTSSIPTHILVYSCFNDIDSNSDNIIHHKNENYLDNTPDNLVLMSRGGHTISHMTEDRKRLFVEKTGRGKLGRDKFATMVKNNPIYLEQMRIRGTQNMSKNWSNPSFVEASRKRISENGKKTSRILNSSTVYRELMEKGKILSGLSRLRFFMLQKDDARSVTEDTYELIRDEYKNNGRRGGNQLPRMDRILKHFDSFSSAYTASATYNHKVVSVSIVDAAEDVYCMEVPKYENFAVDLGDNSCVFVHNCKSVHAEANAIISAKGTDMRGAILYLSGRENGNKIENPQPCAMCRRLIKNAGLSFYSDDSVELQRAIFGDV